MLTAGSSYAAKDMAQSIRVADNGSLQAEAVAILRALSHMFSCDCYYKHCGAPEDTLQLFY